MLLVVRRICGRGFFLLWLGACSTLTGDLRTAETLYRDARYEAAEAWTRVLARERTSMNTSERLWFEYLRGMCAYRLGHPEDSLHSLLLATELAERLPYALRAQDRALMARIVETQIAARRSSPGVRVSRP